MNSIPQRRKKPPIRPAWILAAAILTVVFLLLTLWRVLTPSPIAPPAAPPPIRQPVAGVSQTPSPVRPLSEPVAKPNAASAEQPKTAELPPAAAKDNPAPTKPTEKAKGDIASPATQPTTSPTATASPPRTAAKQPSSDPNQIITETLQAREKELKASEPPSQLPASKQPHDASPATQPDSEQPWWTMARQFAAARQGMVLDARPFPGGTLELPAGFSAPSDDEAFWYLGGGKLITDTGAYSFGLGYEKAAPVMRQELPQLAQQIGLASVTLELHQRDQKLTLRVVAVPKADSPKAVIDKRTEITRLAGVRDRLNYQLREWQRLESSPDSPENRAKKVAVRETIFGILDAQTPPGSSTSPAGNRDPKSPTPGQDSPKTPPESNASRDRKLYSVETLAKNEIARLDASIQQIQNDSTSAVKQSRESEDYAVKQFKASCRKITAVLYQSVKPESTVAESSAHPVTAVPDAASVPRPMPRPSAPKSAGPADLRATPDVPQWPVDYRQEASENAFSPTQMESAKLTVQVISAAGTTLPKWFRDTYILNCTVWEYPKAGPSHVHELVNVDKPKTYSVMDAGGQLAVRFWLSPKKAAAGASVQPIAETSWRFFETLQPGTEYRLRAPLTQEMLVSVRPKTAPATKPEAAGKKPR